MEQQIQFAWRQYKKLWLTKCAATALLVALIVFGGERLSLDKTWLSKALPECCF